MSNLNIANTHLLKNNKFWWSPYSWWCTCNSRRSRWWNIHM